MIDINSDALRNAVFKNRPSAGNEEKPQRQCLDNLLQLTDDAIDSVECTIEYRACKPSPLTHLNKLSIVSAPAAALLLANQSAPVCCIGVLAAVAIPFVLGHFASKKVSSPTSQHSEPEFSFNTSKFENKLATCFNDIMSLIEREKVASKPKSESPELCNNKDFARWVQSFAFFAINSDNSDIHQLLYSMEYQLESLGIYVYYELDFRADGSVSLPDESYFIDDRSSEKWTRVVLPAVYTKDGLLAIGRIV